jgi:uncharacterized coiled-coil DUF342 family protein
MVGENFKRLNRSRGRFKEKLENARGAFTQYVKQADDVNWNWQELRKLEKEVERLEYEVWAEEYEDNRKRNWR